MECVVQFSRAHAPIHSTLTEQSWDTILHDQQINRIFYTKYKQNVA